MNKYKKWALFFGGGFWIKLHKNWLLNGEYNYTKFNSNTKTQEQPVIDRNSNKQDQETESVKNLFKNTIQIFKLGINYNF